MASVFRLGGEGSFGNLYAQDVSDHVGAKPAHQRGAARGVVGLLVVEEKSIHLQPDEMQTKCLSVCVSYKDKESSPQKSSHLAFSNTTCNVQH